MLFNFIEQFWRQGIEMLILWIGLYMLYKSFRATKGARIFLAVVMILVVLTVLAFLLDLKVIAWLLLHSSLFIAFALTVIFQPELRAALSRLGSSRIFMFSQVQELKFAEELKEAVLQLSHKRIGALIALEREISLKEYVENGVAIDGVFSSELAHTIFFPMTALHDGGVVLSKERITAAGCVFPLSKNEMADRTLGLRHRAAVGISEETDAVAIIVSEETGAISIAVNGELYRKLSAKEFSERLAKIFAPEEKEKSNEEENSDVNEELDSENSDLDSSDSDLVSD